MASTKSRELVALCGELVQWRKHGGGGRGKRIPEAVWQRATAVARADGVLATARATGLNLERLQACVTAAEATPSPRRIERRQGNDALAKSHAQGDGPQFVSVRLAPSTRRPALTIELISRSGERMRIESADGLDLTDVVQSFLSRRA